MACQLLKMWSQKYKGTDQPSGNELQLDIAMDWGRMSACETFPNGNGTERVNKNKDLGGNGY